MTVMVVLKIIFVLMLCIPVGYLALRLIVQLIEQLVKEKGNRKR